MYSFPAIGGLVILVIRLAPSIAETRLDARVPGGYLRRAARDSDAIALAIGELRHADPGLGLSDGIEDKATGSDGSIEDLRAVSDIKVDTTSVERGNVALPVGEGTGCTLGFKEDGYLMPVDYTAFQRDT